MESTHTNDGWFKSSRSGNGASCVEIRFTADGGVDLRDTKDQGRGPEHHFTAAEWDAFIGGAKDGEFDLPT